MVEKNLKKLKAKKRRVMNGFNTGTRDMKLKTAYQRKKRWSAEDADHSFEIILNIPVRGNRASGRTETVCPERGNRNINPPVINPLPQDAP